MATALCFARCDGRALRHEGVRSQPVGEGVAVPCCGSSDSRDRPRFLASRAYYAAFHGVTAVLAGRGMEFTKHTAVRAALQRDLIQAGLLKAGFLWQVGGVRCTLERMVTLAEIESAPAGLSPAEKQELMLFLASRLRAEGAPLPEPRTFMPEEIAGWIAEDEADMRRLRERP